MINRISGGVLLLAALACCGAQGAVMFSLMPVGGNVSAPSGQTTGFGFTLTNTGPNYLVVTLSDFCTANPPISSPCVNPLGNYTDFIGNNFVVVGPAPESTTVSQPFNLANQTGTGSFQLFSTDIPATTETGFVILTYDVYATDPVNGGMPTQTGQTIAASASITASPIVVNPVPEPRTALLLGGGCAAVAFSRHRRARRSA